jgi:hypothetical protein
MSSNINPQLNELNDLVNFLYDKKISHVINPYEGWIYISKLMYLYILSKHHNDCIIVADNKDDDIDLRLFLDYDTKSVIQLIYPAKNIQDYYSKINNCKNSGLTFVALPLTISFLQNNNIMNIGHHNMIVINLKTREVYRFEPHGYQYMLDDAYNSIDDVLKNDFENKLNFKYNSAKIVCPRKGFQALESDIELELGEVGYCVAWSYFFLDLILTYPNMFIADVVSKSLDILNNDPLIIRNFIRSYVRFVDIEIENIIEKVFDVNNPYDNPTAVKEKLKSYDMTTWEKGILTYYTNDIKKYINTRLINQAHKQHKFDIKAFKPSSGLLKDTSQKLDITAFKPSSGLLKDTSQKLDITAFKPSSGLLKDTSQKLDITAFKPSSQLLKGGIKNKRKSSHKKNKRKSSSKKKRSLKKKK